MTDPDRAHGNRSSGERSTAATQMLPSRCTRILIASGRATQPLRSREKPEQVQ
jgi:hypothetical protein